MMIAAANRNNSQTARIAGLILLGLALAGLNRNPGDATTVLEGAERQANLFAISQNPSVVAQGDTNLSRYRAPNVGPAAAHSHHAHH